MNGISPWLAGAFCATVIAGAPLLVYLLLSLKVEIRVLARHAAGRDELAARCDELTAALGQLRGRIAEAEAFRKTPAGWTPEQAPLNLNRHGQILRLHGKGKSAAEIATDLQVSKGEVELLLKVHAMGTSEGSLAAPASVL